MSLRQTAELVRTRQVSACELVQQALDRIEARNEALNAFVAVDGDRALAEAAAVDRDPSGPLAGIPIGVKDLEDAAGYRTTHGSLLHADDPPAVADSTLVSRLRAAGCVVVGKTNTPEHGWTGDTYNRVFGPTPSPWHPDRSPGGSSGGTAVALATDMVPLATGSDGGGSIRIPSAACGLPGFKPTLGRIPAGGPEPAGWTVLSTSGPMARTTADISFVYDLVSGPDPRDLRSLPAGNGAAADGLPARVVWCPSIDGGEVDREIAAVCEAAVSRLADAGVDVVAVDSVFDHDPIRSYLVLTGVYAARTFGDVMGTDRWDLVEPALRDVIETALERASAVSVVKAQDMGHYLNDALISTLEQHSAELLVCPTTAGQTPRSMGFGTINGAETANWIRFTYPFNMARTPAGTVPAGFTGDGMPVGLQIAGQRLSDHRVLAAMAAAEEILAVRSEPPLL